MAQVLRRLQADGVHDERDEFRHFRMHKILKCSVVNNSAVCGLPGCFVIILSAFLSLKTINGSSSAIFVSIVFSKYGNKNHKYRTVPTGT